MARLLMRALEKSGHDVYLASSLRSFCREGTGQQQDDIWTEAQREKARILQADVRPDIWFTYHLHYKAPDHLGPFLASEWGIPYVVAEASHAPKRAAGDWARNHALVTDALHRADQVLYLTRADLECLERLLGPEKLRHFPPFIDDTEFSGISTSSNSGLRNGFGLPDVPVLLSVAMMRPGDKMSSYRVLFETLTNVQERKPELPWLMWLIGDGVCRSKVEKLFRPLGENRVRFEGEMPPWALPAIYASSDIYVWPAIREAYGVSFMEAQLCGIPVVAGDTLGVPDVVMQGKTGLLSPEGDVEALSSNLIDLLEDQIKRRSMGLAAETYVRSTHAMEGAVFRLSQLVKDVTT